MFNTKLKEDDRSLDSTRILRWDKLEVLVGPEVFLVMVLLEEKWKLLLPLMILFYERFEWRLEGVRWKDTGYEVLSRYIFESVSNLYWAKWEKYDEVQDTLLIDDDEV